MADESPWDEWIRAVVEAVGNQGKLYLHLAELQKRVANGEVDPRKAAEQAARFLRNETGEQIQKAASASIAYYAGLVRQSQDFSERLLGEIDRPKVQPEGPVSKTAPDPGPAPASAAPASTRKARTKVAKRKA